MNLIIHILWNISEILVTPPMIFIIIVLFVYLNSKNKKIISMQKMISGGSVNSAIELTLSQIVLGILGGVIASLILGALGIVFENNSSIIFLLYISLILMTIKPRFICFSYSSAILGLISIVVKMLNTLGIEFQLQTFFMVNITYLIMFVGILHTVEGILVIIDGHRGAVPIFTERDGKILGGYSLKRYWALPISIMSFITLSKYTSLTNDIITEVPSWWNTINFSKDIVLSQGLGIILLNLFGVIGYSSVTFTRSKREKAISSGIYILSFGIVLTIVAQVARFGIIGELFVVLFTPITHELMLKIQVRQEGKRIPKYISNTEGLMILEIAEDSKFKEFGIDIGSRILSINDKEINSELEIYSILRENLYNAVINIIDSKGNLKEIKFRHKKNNRLGIVLVPKHVQKEDVIEVNSDSFKNILEEIKKKHQKK